MNKFYTVLIWYDSKGGPLLKGNRQKYKLARGKAMSGTDDIFHTGLGTVLLPQLECNICVQNETWVYTTDRRKLVINKLTTVSKKGMHLLPPLLLSFASGG